MTTSPQVETFFIYYVHCLFVLQYHTFLSFLQSIILKSLWLLLSQHFMHFNLFAAFQIDFRSPPKLISKPAIKYPVKRILSTINFFNFPQILQLLINFTILFFRFLYLFICYFILSFFFFIPLPLILT